MKLFPFLQKKHILPENIRDYYSVDFHSHLIPLIDDGVRSIGETKEILSFFEQIGIKKIITTPHISQYFPENNYSKIKTEFEKTTEKLQHTNLSIVFEVAAEYMIDDRFCKLMENEPLLTFGKNYLLIEFSGIGLHSKFPEVLFTLQSKGYNIILAHPERYIFWDDADIIYTNLKERGVFFQLDLLSLTSYYSTEVKKRARHLIEENMVDFISSDIHRSESIPALEEALCSELFQKLIKNNPLKNSDLLH